MKPSPRIPLKPHVGLVGSGAGLHKRAERRECTIFGVPFEQHIERLALPSARPQERGRGRPAQRLRPRGLPVRQPGPARALPLRRPRGPSRPAWLHCVRQREPLGRRWPHVEPPAAPPAARQISGRWPERWPVTFQAGPALPSLPCSTDQRNSGHSSSTYSTSIKLFKGQGGNTTAESLR